MKKFSTIILISFLLLFNNMEAMAEEFNGEEEKTQLSAESIIETITSLESSSDVQEIEKNEEISDDQFSSEKVSYTTDNSSFKNTNESSRGLSGTTGRWFVINGQTMFFSPTINIMKDSVDPVSFSKIISQNSGSSTNFSETILFSDAIVIQALPEVTVPTNTTYSIEYSVDKSNFDSVPPDDVTQLKGIKVVFSKMVSSERVEIKNTATIDWGNTNSGINELAQFFEDDRLNGTVFFDSYRMVTATYVDELGNNLKDPEVFYGELGQEYTTSELLIPNYKLISFPKNATGKFLDEDQVVTYVYERIEGVPVIVNYTDTEGNELAQNETLTGKAGLPYETTAKNIPGWKLTELPLNAKGTFSEEAQTVTYVYKKDSEKESTKPSNDDFSDKNKSSENSSNVSVQHRKDSYKLPHTGERITPSLRIVGAIGLVLFSIFYFYKKVKHIKVQP